MSTKAVILLAILATATLAQSPNLPAPGPNPPAPGPEPNPTHKCDLTISINLLDAIADSLRDIQAKGYIKAAEIQQLTQALLAFSDDCVKIHINDPRPACYTVAQAVQQHIQALLKHLQNPIKNIYKIIGDLTLLLADGKKFRKSCLNDGFSRFMMK